MTNTDPTTDPIVRDLRRLFDYELARARQRPSQALSAMGTGRRPRYGANLVLVLAFAAIGLTLIGTRLPTAPAGIAPTFIPTHAAATETLRAAVTPNPSAEESVAANESPGPLIDGIPVHYGGVQVLRGPEMLDRIAESTDSSPFIAGGWFRTGRWTRFCPYQRFDPAVELCSTFPLFPEASGGEPVWIGRGDPEAIRWGLTSEATRPVILRLHTHDPRCAASDEGCPERPILTEVVWLGEVAGAR